MHAQHNVAAPVEFIVTLRRCRSACTTVSFKNNFLATLAAFKTGRDKFPEITKTMHVNARLQSGLPFDSVNGRTGCLK